MGRVSIKCPHCSKGFGALFSPGTVKMTTDIVKAELAEHIVRAHTGIQKGKQVSDRPEYEKKFSQVPSVGRIVHFRTDKDEVYPAVVVAMNEGLPTLKVMTTDGDFIHENGTEGTEMSQWFWPERG